MTTENLQKIVKVLDKYQSLMKCEDVDISMHEVSFYAPSCNDSLIRNMLSCLGSVNCSCNTNNKIVLYVIN